MSCGLSRETLLGGPSRGIPEGAVIGNICQNAVYESGTFQREASRETRGGFYLKANGHICHPLCLGKSMLAPEKLDFTILDKISQLFPVEMYEKEQENEKA